MCNSVGEKFDLHNFADYFVVHKNSCKKHLVEREGVSAQKIKVIPHGTLVFPQIPTKTARLRLGLPLDCNIILSHAFLERRKNIDKIIKAVAELKNELPIYYVHVGGLHPRSTLTNGQMYFNECQRLIKDLGVGSGVKIISRFTHDDELAFYMNAADAIITLENSSFPNLCSSGIMHTVVPGKTVIASDVENFDDLPEGTFYKVNIEDDKLNFALKEVLTRSEISKKISENLTKYTKETSWSKIAQEHIELYKRCNKSHWPTIESPNTSKTPHYVEIQH